MHILVVNDDGPPQDSCSPYILSFVTALRNAGHTVSVVLPSLPQSWITKAHLVGKALTARPPCLDDHIPELDGIEWTFVDGTPASCTQLGLYHLALHHGPVDLVISGPNWGRNVTTLYNLASGTVGGALEAAQCGKKAIAISFASKDPQALKTIEAACALSVKLVSHLYHNWAADVELYAINVPMLPDVYSRKIVYTLSTPCFWTQSSLFQAIDPQESQTNLQDNQINSQGKVSHKQSRQERRFKWAPALTDVDKAINSGKAGTDAWAVKQGFTSVTPMLATFKSVEHVHGVLEL